MMDSLGGDQDATEVLLKMGKEERAAVSAGTTDVIENNSLLGALAFTSEDDMNQKRAMVETQELPVPPASSDPHPLTV